MSLAEATQSSDPDTIEKVLPRGMRNVCGVCCKDGHPSSSAGQMWIAPSSSMDHISEAYRKIFTMTLLACALALVYTTLCVGISISSISPVFVPSHSLFPSSSTSFAGLNATAVALTVSPCDKLMSNRPVRMFHTFVTYPVVHMYSPQMAKSLVS